MAPELADKIKHCPNLPSLPSIAVQVVDLAQNADADIIEIARAISKDPALSSKILKTVNSSFYGRSKNVSTISQALVILGLQSVRTLVLGFSLVGGLSKKKTKAFPHIDFWKRSLFSATAAKVIALKIAFPDTEEAFLAALLMDIGMLALDLVLPERYGDVYAQSATHDGLARIEREMLETDHAEVAGILFDFWKLPSVLQRPVAHHHTPADVGDPQQHQLAQLINIAGSCANVFIEPQTPETIAEVQAKLQTHYNIVAADAEALLSEIGRKTRDLASLFEINLGPTQDFDAILKKASDTLVQLSLQAGDKGTATEAKAVSAVVELATREATETFIEAKFNVAREMRAAISLLMLEIDDLTAVETKAGKAGVEAVQAFAARVLAAAARANHFGGRGEATRLMLVMPGADRSTSAALAETIRRAICARPISAGTATHAATLSVGVASFQPGTPFRTGEHLIKAAEAAFLNARRSGKNSVRVFSLPVPAKAA